MGGGAPIVLFTPVVASGKLVGEAVSVAAQAGIPQIPLMYTPSIDDLRFTNMGLGLVAVAFRLLCESTLSVAEKTQVSYLNT